MGKKTKVTKDTLVDKDKASPGDPDTTAQRRKPRFKPDTVAKRAVNKEQKRTELVIPRAVFKRCAVEARQKVERSKMRYESAAVTALQQAVEAFVVQWFQAGDMVRRCSGTKKRAPVQLLLPRHLHAANAVGRIMAPHVSAFWPETIVPPRAPPTNRYPEPGTEAAKLAKATKATKAAKTTEKAVDSDKSVKATKTTKTTKTQTVAPKASGKQAKTTSTASTKAPKAPKVAKAPKEPKEPKEPNVAKAPKTPKTTAAKPVKSTAKTTKPAKKATKPAPVVEQADSSESSSESEEEQPPPSKPVSRPPPKVTNMPPPLLTMDARQRAEQEKLKAAAAQSKRVDQRRADSQAAQAQLGGFENEIRQLVGLNLKSPQKFY